MKARPGTAGKGGLVKLAEAVALAVGVVGVALGAGAEEPRYVEHFLTFRSMATGRSASDVEVARCAAHFADRPGPSNQLSQLDYFTHGITVDPETGLVTDDHALVIGEDCYLCSVAPADVQLYPPFLEDAGGFQSWSYLNLPGFPELQVEGPCRPATTVNEGELFFNCKLAVLPDATKGIIGGFMSTNSVLNRGTGGYPTGSLWTGYLVTVAP